MKKYKITLSIMILTALLIAPKIKAISTDALDINTVMGAGDDNKIVTMNKFRSMGKGTLYFTVDYFNPGSQVAATDSLIREIIVYNSNNDAYECKIGNTIGYRDNNVYHNVISVECPIELPNDKFLYQMKFRRTSAYGTNEAMLLRTSEWITFIEEGNIQSTTDAINNNWNNFNNTDISNNDKDPVDGSAYENTSQTEQDIYDTLFTNAPNVGDVLDFTIDTQSNGWIWNTMQTLMNTNLKIIGMVVAILSIGVAKMIMGR